MGVSLLIQWSEVVNDILGEVACLSSLVTCPPLLTSDERPATSDP